MTLAAVRQRIKKVDLDNAKQHIIIALEEMTDLPKTHEELIERMRSYFEDQRIEEFSAFLYEAGEEDFREFIAEVVVDSGKYRRKDDGSIVPV